MQLFLRNYFGAFLSAPSAETKVVNLCSGKPGLPVKVFLPLVPVKITFTGKTI